MLVFKQGDVLSIDGVEFEVESVSKSLNGYWLKESGGTTYYYSLRWLGQDELVELLADERLVLGRVESTKGGNKNCYHVWKRYTGITNVYDYCDWCNAKRQIDWKDINDGKSDLG